MAERRFIGPIPTEGGRADLISLPPPTTEEQRGDDMLEEMGRALARMDGPDGNGNGVSGAKASDLLRALSYCLPSAVVEKLSAFDVDPVSELHKLSRQLEAVGY